ncbi:MAG TPA: tetratricopeptide repeat protein [Pirellulaceae bacterium]|nr:tetratricopeptide repeat protein [Pirellulaceae bacterium]
MVKDQGKFDEAVVACRMAITIRPDHADAHEHLGRLLSLMGRADQAIDVYRHWLSYDESNPVALHMLAACKGRDAPGRASDRYLQLVFDGLANSFEQNLKSLDYCAPELLAAAISKEVMTTLSLPNSPNI